MKEQYAICYELPDEVVPIYTCYTLVELLEEWEAMCFDLDDPIDSVYFCTVYTGGDGNWSAKYDFVPTLVIGSK